MLLFFYICIGLFFNGFLKHFKEVRMSSALSWTHLDPLLLTWRCCSFNKVRSGCGLFTAAFPGVHVFVNRARPSGEILAHHVRLVTGAPVCSMMGEPGPRAAGGLVRPV